MGYVELEQKIRDKTARVGVVGLGYVGLPLLRAFIRAGFSTIGFDVDETKVQKLNAGQSYIGHIPSQWIREWIEMRRFEATADMGRLNEPDAILICVPTRSMKAAILTCNISKALRRPLQGS